MGGNPFAEEFDFNNDGVIETDGYDYFTLRSTFNLRFSTLPYEINHVFHEGAQDDWRGDSSGVEYYQLFGTQDKKRTPEQIIAKKRARLRGFSRSGTIFEIKEGFGDKTVPVLSAERIGNKNLNGPTITQNFAPLAAIGETDDDVEHNGLTKNTRVQQRIFEILGITSQSVVGSATHQGKEENEMSSNGKDPGSEANYLSIEGVETLRITDDLGRTNTPINEYFEDKIPEVDYESVYIDGVPIGWYLHDLTLPTEHEYSIKFRTASDSVDIALVRGIGNASPNYAVRYIDLELPTDVECLLTVNAQGMDDLRYDSNGDGTYDTAVPAHVRVSGTAAQDVTAPAVTLTYSRVTGGGRVVTINATDTETGVQTIYYRVRETGNYKIYTDPFSIPVITDQVVEAFADDNVGNRSSPIRVVVPNFNVP